MIIGEGRRRPVGRPGTIKGKNIYLSLEFGLVEKPIGLSNSIISREESSSYLKYQFHPLTVSDWYKIMEHDW